MNTRDQRANARSAFVVAAACTLLAGIALLSLAQPAQAEQAGLPPRFTPTPTPTPASTPAPPRSASAWGAIELDAQFPSTWPWASSHWQDLWTGVQWQDAHGNWHDVEGWQGALDGVSVDESGSVVGRKTWWVAGADLGKGPFRWQVTRGEGGGVLVTSAPFNLPCCDGAIIVESVWLQ